MSQTKIIKMPKYLEIPDLGLYMDQVLDQINSLTSQFTSQSLTKSMINSYVKKGLVSKPKIKRYYRKQLAEIILISIFKTTFSIDEIKAILFQNQKDGDLKEIYDQIIKTFENQANQKFSQATNLMASSIAAVTNKLSAINFLLNSN